MAMIEAEIGDDVYGEDPTVNALEKYAAELCGKEAALFVVSGTMGNLISVACHCYMRGSEVYLGDKCHIYKYEQGGIAQLCGITPRTIPNREDGTFDLSTLKSRFSTGSDPHFNVTSLVAIENTFNGKVLPLSFMKEVRQVADRLKIPVHLDGARLMNAVAATKLDVKEITKYVDSANLCLSKGLCSPVGSVIVGSKELISRARRMRKVLGGGMRQAGMLAAAGMMSLDFMSKRLHHDHDNARYLAQGLMEFNSKYLELNMELVHTNMVFFKINPLLPVSDGKSECSAAEFVNKLLDADYNETAVIKVLHMGENVIRAVFYNDVSSEDAKKALKAIKNVFRKWKV